MKDYKTFIEADILSCLSKKELEERLVIALYESEEDRTIYDGENKKLTVIDYIETNAERM